MLLEAGGSTVLTDDFICNPQESPANRVCGLSSFTVGICHRNRRGLYWKLPHQTYNGLAAMLEYAGLIVPAGLLFLGWYFDLPEPEKVPGPPLADWLIAIGFFAAMLALAALTR